MNEKYFVISMDDDGAWGFDEFNTVEEIVEEYGLNEPVEDYKEGCHPAEDFTTYLDENMSNFHPGKVIIYGKIVLPKLKKVVVKWELLPE